MGTVTPFPKQAGTPSQVAFDRQELTRILDLYGRMVAAGHWRDYAIDLGREAAIFSAFRRATERPEFRIEKRPSLRQRQGMWALVGEAGQVIKRGHELGPVLAPVERRLLKLVEE
jgi:hypothetical protein